MSIVLLGSTSGSCTLQEQAVAGTTTLTLPTITGTVGVLVSGTAVASTSGTSIDFTSLPAGIRRITVMFDGLSSSGTSLIQIQLGTGGVAKTTGYVSSTGRITGANACSFDNATTGFTLYAPDAAALRSGAYTFTNLTSNTWCSTGNAMISSGQTSFNSGAVTLSGALNLVRITTVNGTDTFDAGSINILYE